MTARHSSLARSLMSEELLITRVFDAPREVVWEAWTDPARFMLWWGPEGFACPECRIDLRAGRKYLYCMRSPEGQEYWNTGVYRVIVPTKRMVWNHSFADEKGNVVAASYYGMRGYWPVVTVVTVTFEKDDGETILTLQHNGIPPVMKSGYEAGWSGSFAKLARIL